MPKEDNIKSYDTSLDKLVSGIHKVVEVLKPTYGAAGGNIVIENSLPPYHSVRNDGKLIVDAIYLADPVEKMGKDILAEVCDKQEKEAGDGRKTTCILTASILNEGLKYKDKATPLEIKKSLDECLPIIIKSIDDQKKDIKPEEVELVAAIASESKEIGKLIGDAYKEIGKEGIIEIEPSGLSETYYEVIDGVRIRGTKILVGWQTEPDTCVIENPKIVVCKEKITSVGQIEEIHKQCLANKIPAIVLYCEDMDMSVMARLARNNVAADSGELRVKTLVLKAPTLWKDWFYEDLQILTGAQSIDVKEGRTFASFKFEQMGKCDVWKSNKEESRIRGVKDVSEYKQKLIESPDDQQKLRASWLNSKTAVLKIGANSESELSWKIRKAKDATHAAYYALKDGVVVGAGVSLVQPVASMVTLDTIGSKILAASLMSPAHQLRINQGEAILSLKPEGVLDPAIVIKSAITNAISIAGIILTTKGALVIPQEIKDIINQMNARRMPQ